MVNATYIMDALGQFMKILKKKRPAMVARDCCFTGDNDPVHTTAIATNWMAARQIRVIEHPLWPPDLAPADFSLFPRVKRELACLILTQKMLKKEREGAVQTIMEADFAMVLVI